MPPSWFAQKCNICPQIPSKPGALFIFTSLNKSATCSWWITTLWINIWFNNPSLIFEEKSSVSIQLKKALKALYRQSRIVNAWSLSWAEPLYIHCVFSKKSADVLACLIGIVHVSPHNVYMYWSVHECVCTQQKISSAFEWGFACVTASLKIPSHLVLLLATRNVYF